MGRVEGKVAVVTGGASGLGRAIAARLAAEGARVTITDIDEAAGARVAAEHGLQFVAHDVTDEDAWRRVMDGINARCGGPDILVNNAGIGEASAGSDPETTRLQDWNRTFAVNATGVFLGCRAAIPLMRNRGGGSIVNVSSVAALAATPFVTAYGASKAAVRQLTTSVALHCAERGDRIRCNSVHPGQIETPMLESLFASVGRMSGLPAEAVQAEFLKLIPLGEFGTPDDVAWMVLYLASDESRHVTGAQFAVDGGMSIRALAGRH